MQHGRAAVRSLRAHSLEDRVIKDTYVSTTRRVSQRYAAPDRPPQTASHMTRRMLVPVMQSVCVRPAAGPSGLASSFNRNSNQPVSQAEHDAALMPQRSEDADTTCLEYVRRARV